MKKIVFSAIIFLLLISLTTASANVSPKDLGSARVQVTMEWSLTAGKDVSNAVLKTFSFENNEHQNVAIEASDVYEEEKDENGNPRLIFKWSQKAGETKKIKLTATATVNFNGGLKKISALKEEYAKPTTIVVLNDDIRATAERVAGELATPEEKLVALTEWVHNYVEYDESYWNRLDDSAYILESRRGVCKDYSHLLMSLLHAQGIHSRLAAGYVFSGEKWAPHAWVEAAINGEWVPADPTFNEVKRLDASHVLFAANADQSQVTEQITEGLEMTKDQPIAEILEYTPFPKFFKLEASGPDNVGPNALEQVTAEVQNLDTEWQAIPLNLIVPQEPEESAVSVVEGEKKLVFLPPGGKKKTSWKTLFPKELKEGYQYSFPIQVKSLSASAGFTTTGTVTGKKNEVSQLTITDVTTVQKNNEISFYATLQNAGNTPIENAQVTAELEEDTKQETISLEVNEKKTISFSFALPIDAGTYRGKITAQNRGTKTSQPIQLTVTPAPSPTTGGFESIPLAVTGTIAIILILVLTIIYHRNTVKTRK